MSGSVLVLALLLVCGFRWLGVSVSVSLSVSVRLGSVSRAEAESRPVELLLRSRAAGSRGLVWSRLVSSRPSLVAIVATLGRYYIIVIVIVYCYCYYLVVFPSVLYALQAVPICASLWNLSGRQAKPSQSQCQQQNIINQSCAAAAAATIIIFNIFGIFFLVTFF